MAGSGPNLAEIVGTVRPEKGGPRPRYVAELESFTGAGGLETFREPPDRSGDAFSRMFSSGLGKKAADIVGNEGKTLNLLNAIGADLMLEVLEVQGFFKQRGWKPPTAEGSDLRAVVLPSQPDSTPALVILDANRGPGDTRLLTNEAKMDPGALEHVWTRSAGQSFGHEDDLRSLVEFLYSQGPQALAETLVIVQPDIAVSRRPKMVPLCAPWPNLEIRSGHQTSTAGIFCRDVAGTLGVTACFHGTGPVGTAVQVGLQNSSVAIANNVQDTVFVPVGAGYNIPALRGVQGVLRGRTPGQYDKVEFHGSASGAVETRVTSYDAGLLRSRPTVQLRVQTPADTNTGDSGSALINQDDRIIGFAFERTAFGEIPEMTDWIWADNALKTLGLTPA